MEIARIIVAIERGAFPVNPRPLTTYVYVALTWPVSCAVCKVAGTVGQACIDFAEAITETTRYAIPVPIRAKGKARSDTITARGSGFGRAWTCPGYRVGDCTGKRFGHRV